MIAGIEHNGIIISKARDSKKYLNFQDWVLQKVEDETLGIEELWEVFYCINDTYVRLENPFPFEDWSRFDRIKGKRLIYSFAHRYILISLPYEHLDKQIIRIDTHFRNEGRIYLYKGMSKNEICQLIEKWSYRSRSKDFCWAIVYLIALVWLMY